MMAMAERETRAMTALARAMRLTHQSRLKAETASSKARTMPTGPKPWDESSWGEVG
jgi:hypothetical protein